MVDSVSKIATEILKQREIIERFYLQRRRSFSKEVFELSIADDEFPPWENLEENLGVVLHLLVSPAAAAAAHAQSEKHDSETTQTSQTDLQKSSHFKISKFLELMDENSSTGATFSVGTDRDTSASDRFSIGRLRNPKPETRDSCSSS